MTDAPHAPHDPRTADAERPVAPNYAYWREHGGAWVAEYQGRKRYQVLYHIQELMLANYMLCTAQGRERPLRVLEFGCGVGRHLRNLSGLPNVDVHGYDQSEAMARGCLTWCDEGWFASHVSVGEPTGPLPYDDASFDVVYSAEVLVHVRPEDLPVVLAEIMRVCRGHVLHLEPSPGVEVHGEVHQGCWNHDLVKAYRGLGRACEVLPCGYEVHTPYRVRVGEKPRFTWPREMLDMCLRMERDINEGFRIVQQGSVQEPDPTGPSAS
ncbi:hypothetical protein PHYC_01160 [Phycisphaerales bacterium]|nr:hypothetical protein PHYC_01160 [Phycisphaerales bacterium]